MILLIYRHTRSRRWTSNDFTRLIDFLVCRSTIEEVENVLSKVDPKQDIEIGNYRLDADGNVIRKKVSFFPTKNIDTFWNVYDTFEYFLYSWTYTEGA